MSTEELAACSHRGSQADAGEIAAQKPTPAGTLLAYASNTYSQNGEDGIIARSFSIIGSGNRRCCEYGAWDGIHLSNTRALIERGWSGALIESDEARFNRLKGNTQALPRVTAIQARVGTTENRLSVILKKAGVSPEMDFLSIDVDGLDYDLFLSLDNIRPRLICVEVNAGHDPASCTIIPRQVAAGNVGQPLSAFVSAADKAGYRLICYTGNAFFLRVEEAKQSELPTLAPGSAYDEFLRAMSPAARRWLHLVNLGLAPPYYQFQNSLLSSSAFKPSRLGIAGARVRRLAMKGREHFTGRIGAPRHA
jgi:hypothetical protein